MSGRNARPAGMHRRSMCLLLAVALSFGAFETASADALRDGFADPPNAARPRVWWHWMSGNVTQEGIVKDLDWMQRIGIGGLQQFDVNLHTPQLVAQPRTYMSAQWNELFRFAVERARQKGLEFAIAASPGWSETGGPWVTPQDAVKKLVWSETRLQGSERSATKLPQPPTTTGPFQDVPYVDMLAALGGGGLGAAPDHYADVAVLAYRDAYDELSAPTMTAGDGGRIDAHALTDGSYRSAVTVPRTLSNAVPQSITIDYGKPQTVRSVTLHLPEAAGLLWGADVLPRLDAKEGDGWRRVTDIELDLAPTTASFPPVTAATFRVVFAPQPANTPVGNMAPAPGIDPAVGSGMARAPAADLRVAELRLSSASRVDRFERKAAFAIANDYFALGEQSLADAAGVAPSEVVDLTFRMQPDGTLDWTPPKGRWRVLRLGWSLTGKMNYPATREATGLEVDKMDGRAVRRYLDHYLRSITQAVGPELVGNGGVRALLVDSTGVGAFNWTPDMVAAFERLRGYDPRPWMPALTGVLIGSRRQSDAFLYDFRRTIAELHATEHYATLSAVAHEHGLEVYGEALENGRPSLGDDMQMRRYADVPMAALWTYPADGDAQPAHRADLRGAASTGHLFGQTIVAAESLTSMLAPWAHAPADLRRIVDLEFVSGINRPVIHTSVHQPVDDKVPGLALLVFGQYFNRHESWAELARPWVDYLARSSFMLQQGRYVADVAYFYGEEGPLTALYKERPVADAPVHYAYDFVNADALHHVLSVKGGDLVAPSGARYRLLYLGGSSRRMTLPTLQRLADLASAGATVVGLAPESSPSLGDDAAAFADLRSKLWSGPTVAAFGKGKVIATTHVEAALALLDVTPDFTFAKPAADSEVLFLHRELQDGHVYFLSNRRDRAERIEARFRVSGKAPEIWRADTGSIAPCSYRVVGNHTIVPLELSAGDSFFVVFREPTSAASRTVPPRSLVSLAQLDGEWNVEFQAKRGAPPAVRLPQLSALSEHAEPGVKFFSGIATYRTSFELPKGAANGRRLVLDLGRVGDIAEVRVNGQTVGTAWHAPYRVEIGAAVVDGSNSLEVRVANLWVNRLIGDAQPGAAKVTWTALPTYTASAPLRASGLIGPVTLLSERK